MKTIIELNQKDIEKIIAEHFNVSIDNVDIKIDTILEGCYEIEKQIIIGNVTTNNN